MNAHTPHSRYQTARRFLIFWTLFIGLGALAGGTAMLIDPTGKALGMDAMLPYFQVLPLADVLFRNFTFSGIALLIVNGFSNLTAAALLLRKKPLGVTLGGLFGLTLMLWICIQFYMFPLNFMSTAYFIFGLAQALTGFAAKIFYKQETFTVRESDYPHVGENKKRLVVYFSRLGYGKKLAYRAANRTGAEIYEIRSTERTEGTLGFWWCGRFAMHRWDMPIEPIAVDLEKYDTVTICAPIWDFALAAPVRAFCRQASGKIKAVNYILVHHTSAVYENAVREMDSLLNLTHSGFVSVRCKTGKFKTVKCTENDTVCFTETSP